MNMQSHSDGQVVAGEPFTHKDYPPGTWICIDEALLKHMDVRLLQARRSKPQQGGVGLRLLSLMALTP